MPYFFTNNPYVKVVTFDNFRKDLEPYNICQNIKVLLTKDRADGALSEAILLEFIRPKLMAREVAVPNSQCKVFY